LRLNVGKKAEGPPVFRPDFNLIRLRRRDEAGNKSVTSCRLVFFAVERGGGLL
jgi:hypothetical protein